MVLVYRLNRIVLYIVILYLLNTAKFGWKMNEK